MNDTGGKSVYILYRSEELGDVMDASGWSSTVKHYIHDWHRAA